MVFIHDSTSPCSFSEKNLQGKETCQAANQAHCSQSIALPSPPALRYLETCSPMLIELDRLHLDRVTALLNICPTWAEMIFRETERQIHTMQAFWRNLSIKRAAILMNGIHLSRIASLEIHWFPPGRWNVRCTSCMVPMMRSFPTLTRKIWYETVRRALLIHLTWWRMVVTTILRWSVCLGNMEGTSQPGPVRSGCFCCGAPL